MAFPPFANPVFCEKHSDFSKSCLTYKNLTYIMFNCDNTFQ